MTSSLLSTARVLFFLPVVFFAGMTSGFGDALFVHETTTRDYLSGNQEVATSVGFSENGMVVDKTTRYVGSWMKRFFGEVKTRRETTHFLLSQREIREIDHGDRMVRVYQMADLDKIDPSSREQILQEQADAIIKERYEVKPPTLSLKTAPQTERMEGFECRRIAADLRLETYDKKKRAASVTLIHQEVWLSNQVPGFDLYQAFHSELARVLGMDAMRAGPFGALLRSFTGPLDPIRSQLQAADGYPVRQVTTVDAQYITGIDTKAPKTITKRIKEETSKLKTAAVETLDMSRFDAPEGFGVKMMP